MSSYAEKYGIQARDAFLITHGHCDFRLRSAATIRSTTHYESHCIARYHTQALRHRTESAQIANQVFHRNLQGVTTLPPSITKAVDETCVNQKGTAGDETFKVTLTVKGDGGTSTSITPIDIVFALDSSGSMFQNDPTGLRKTASKGLVDKLNSNRDTGGVVSWDDNVDFTFGLSGDFERLKTEIDRVNDSGQTNLNVGLQSAIALLRANTRTAPSNEIIIFLNDGSGTYTPCASNGPAKDALANGIVIYSIGLGSNADTSALADMAACTGGQVYPEVTPANLQAIFDEIFDAVVNSSIPHNVDVLEVIEDGIDVNAASITPKPSSVKKDSSGRITSIRWNDIDDLDNDDGMEAGEEVLLSYEAKSAGAGSAKKIAPNSKVFYTPFDDDLNEFFVATPQNTVNVNAPPSAVCKSFTKEAGDGCSACFFVSDVNGGSSDPYTCPTNTSPTLSLADPTCFGVGDHTVTLTATDDNSLMDRCDAAVTVRDTTPPVITCPIGITLDTEPGVCTATVPVGFFATSTDFCGSSVTTSVAEGSTLKLGGPTTITFTATDTNGNDATPCDAGITVVDKEDPTFDSNLPECLWPANHKYFCMDESTVVTAADNCPGASTIKVTACTSNQDENANGDGNSVLDCVVENDKLCIRAERQGISQEDRVYTVTVEVTDDAGNTASKDFEVDVPHDQNPLRDCVPGTIKDGEM
jgi:hypothetical protein